MYQLEKEENPFRFTEVNARHASEILINDPGIIQNKLPPHRQGIQRTIERKHCTIPP